MVGELVSPDKGLEDLCRIFYAELLVLKGEEHDLPLAVQGGVHVVPSEHEHHRVLGRDLASLFPEV